VAVTDTTPEDDRDAEQQRSQRVNTGGHGKHAADRGSGLPVSLVALSAATGVLIVAATYTAGRLGHASSPWADRSYWLGQAFILVPAAARLVSRRILTTAETVIVITVLTIAEYVATVCYSPAGFTFGDELEHWRSTTNILQTGRLLTPNYLLPISPHYPGLEEVTSALVSVTGLSVFSAGLIIAGVAHLLFVWVLYLLFREFSDSHRVGGVAVICYASNSHFASFDSMFIYQTLALPFLGLTLLAAWRLTTGRSSGQRDGWLIFAVLVIGATVVTHHVTSYVLVATLLIFTLAAALTRDWRTARWIGGLALLSAAAAVSWLVFAAPQTWPYLEPFADGTLRSIQALFAGTHSAAPSTSGGPVGNRLLAAVSVLIVSALVPVGWWQVWRKYRSQLWIVTLSVVSATWYGTVAVRFTVADGSELAGRAATFTFVPAALMAALGLGLLIGVTARRLARVIGFCAPAVVLLLTFDGLANGWPPFWERLPGSHQVAGSERSVGPEEIAVANWALAALGPGNRFAADAGSYSVIGSYGDQSPQQNVAYLYLSSSWASVAAGVQAQKLRYVWVDQRLSQSLPASGQYFPIDPHAGRYSHPLPANDLGKFYKVKGISRIFDDGNIVIYDLAGT
jgi:4-amino-4-deoxy-L-arabinose transferase-like glycosyltransferase